MIEIHPICDTDIWITLSSIDELEIIFKLSYGAYISDAVKFELQCKKDDSEDEFGHAFFNYKKYLDEKLLKRIDFNNDSYFNEEIRLLVSKKFVELRIPYNFETRCFDTRKKNMGETVTVIYAGVLELPVILSNDNETPTLVKNHYNWVKVYDINALLTNADVDIARVRAIRDKIKSSSEQNFESQLQFLAKKFCIRS